MSTVHRDLRFRHRSQALTLWERYGRAPGLKPGEGSFAAELFGRVVGGMADHSDYMRNATQTINLYRQLRTGRVTTGADPGQEGVSKNTSRERLE
jgi:hypothetical protein